ncbi:MAG: 4-hydroxy-tetrahydrodipicolinate reductase [Leptospiraceae bacterium]|nr:4-hydroxy-tetrahydrodipicolinate reductase [Leptospiraceae bacterium]MCB1200430.1 4-hydroxy-tetrahydrodipicolinate reductase [Leptospiraceae bacterium]
MIRIALVGALGRMGQAIARLADGNSNFSVTATIERDAHEQIGQSYAELTGIKHVKTEIASWSMLENADSLFDAAIDFSVPASTLITAMKCEQLGKPLVVGTTGWVSNELEKLQSVSSKIPLLISFNMSVGVNLLFSLAEKAAASLAGRDFDIEIMEVHHKHKKDAPSGTSRSLEKILLNKTNMTNENLVHAREGIVGERPRNQIGSFALRGGDVVGDHTVYFFGEGERIEIRHTATSRDIFARGALDAASWLTNREPGSYTMQDVLSL